MTGGTPAPFLSAGGAIPRDGTGAMCRGDPSPGPPARRAWDAEEAVTLSEGNLSVSWPPRSWKSLIANFASHAVYR